MRCEWKKVKISDVCKICYGKDHKQLLDGNVPAYGSGGIIRRVNKSIHEKKSVLIPRKGSLDNLFFVDPPFWTVDTLFWTDIDETKINPAFFFYQLKTLDLASKNVGTAVPSLTTSVLNDIEINLPSMDIQKKIAAILSALDEKIATNRAINDNLQQQVSALYQSWFEDFEPSNGICPEHWSYQELSTIANIVSGKRPPIKSEVCNQETSIPIVGAASIMGFTSQSNHTDKILVTGRVGTHGVVQRFDVPCWTSDNTLVITSPFYEFTNQILCGIDYSSMNRGSTQPLITQGDMKKVIVLIPDEKTLAKFEEFAGSLMAKWEANNHENIQLALLRDSLLPKLMSGEIDVSAVHL